MKRTVNEYDMKRIFAECHRDYFSIEGCEELLNFYNEIDPDMEFDPIAICCDCTEYWDPEVSKARHNDEALEFDDLIHDYGYLLPLDGWKEDKDEDELEDMSDDEQTDAYIEDLLDRISKFTTVLSVENGNYIIFSL